MTKEEIENSINQYNFSVCLYKAEVDKLENILEVQRRILLHSETRLQELQNELKSFTLNDD